MKPFKKPYYRAQVDDKDCGVACLAMVLEYYGSHYSLLTLRNLAKTTQDGTTAFGLVTDANALHLNTQAIKTDITLFQSDAPYPFIAHVIKDGTRLHYYTIIGCDDETVHIADPDPAVKITRLPWQRFEQEWTGIALLFEPDADYQPYREKTRGLWSFLPLLMKQKPLITGIALATLGMTVIDIIGAYYLQLMIDLWIPQHALNTLGVVSLALFISYTLQQLITYLQSQGLLLLGQHLSVDIILSYIEHLFRLPLAFFQTRRTGEIVSRFTDANAIIEALASTVLSVFLDVSVASIMAVVLCWQHPLLFLISIASLPIYAIIVFAFMRPFQRLNHAVMETNAKLSSSIIDDLSGIETIKALSSEDTRYERIDQEFHDHLTQAFRYGRSENFQTALKAFMHLALNVLILWFGAQFVVSGQMTLGQLITFNTLLVYFTQPLENIVNLQTKLQRANVANERLNEVQQIDSEFATDQHLLHHIPWHHELTMHAVDFAYGYETNVLNQINLQIPKGTKLAIVGLSGSGKTTLAKLLVNFYTPTDGTIKLDQMPLSAIDKHTLRQFITYLPQQPYIFNGTIRENLLLGAKPTTTEQDISDILQLVELYDDVMHLPMQLDTELTSDGTEISGGQRQRLALARALLTQSPILILDEATSSLDLLTEKVIINRLLALDKTIIFIAHRLTVAERADRVVVMSKGRIVEEGTHASLLKKGGLYANLIRT
ncbi:MAG: peptide cleavage/export ABC transporter [Aerococcus sp.]|nr:peptide cleavage/export ABC transporter [Aerococcus sp.]